MNRIFLIRSSVSGHLGCFHVLAVVNSAAINIQVHMSFSIMVSSGYMPSSGTLGHMVVLFLVLNDGFFANFQTSTGRSLGLSLEDKYPEES